MTSRILISLALLALPAVPAAASADTLTTLSAATPIAAHAGLAAWSAYDAAHKQWSLMAAGAGGAVRALPVPPSPTAFGVGLGTAANGDPVAVDARCTTGPTDPFDGPPGDGPSGCALEQYDFATGALTPLAVTAPQGAEISDPVVSAGRIAFAYVRPGEHRPRLAVAALDARGPATEAGRGPLRFCSQTMLRGRPRRVCAPAKDVRLGGLSLDGGRLAFSWSYYGYNDGGPAYRSDLWVDDLDAGGSPQLVARSTGDSNAAARYGAVSLDGDGVEAVLTCSYGPACVVVAPAVQRLALGAPHAVAASPLAVAPVRSALDGDAAVLLTRAGSGPGDGFDDCAPVACTLQRAPLAPFVALPPLPAPSACGIVHSHARVLSVTSAGRGCGTARALVARVVATVLHRTYGRDGGLACVRIGQPGLGVRPGQTILACRRPGVSVRAAYAGGAQPGS